MLSRVNAMLFAMCLCAGTVSAQETINTGSISGRVTDPQGAVRLVQRRLHARGERQG